MSETVPAVPRDCTSSSGGRCQLAGRRPSRAAEPVAAEVREGAPCGARRPAATLPDLRAACTRARAPLHPQTRLHDRNEAVGVSWSSIVRHPLDTVVYGEVRAVWTCYEAAVALQSTRWVCRS